MGFFSGLIEGLTGIELEEEFDVEGNPVEEDGEDKENPWHEINTIAGAYCVQCGRGIMIGEYAWWNHKTRDVACGEDGQELFDEEEEARLGEKIGEVISPIN